jgi:uncharacterized membrane protein (UPF0136 family)
MTASSIAPLAAGGAFGIGLLASGIGVVRGKDIGFLMSPLLTVLLVIFFGYRFVEGGEIFPSGLLAALGLIAFFIYCAWRR